MLLGLSFPWEVTRLESSCWRFRLSTNPLSVLAARNFNSRLVFSSREDRVCVEYFQRVFLGGIRED